MMGFLDLVAVLTGLGSTMVVVRTKTNVIDDLDEILEKLIKIETQSKMIGEVVIHLSENEVRKMDCVRLSSAIKSHTTDVENLIARVETMIVSRGGP